MTRRSVLLGAARPQRLRVPSRAGEKGPIPLTRFALLGLSEPTLRALRDLGYETPTPIQDQTIRSLLADRDVVGQAQTGTGKTAAFMLPILERIDLTVLDVQALVLCPTRELALQVTDATRGFAAYRPGVRVAAVYGGASMHDQLDQLRRGAQIVVGTPGRVLDLVRRGRLILADARMVVLDEADEMLSMGFIDDVRAILRATPQGRQTALFSATLPPPIQALAREELHAAQVVSVEPDRIAIDLVDQRVVTTQPSARLATLERVLDVEQPTSAIIFCRTKVSCRRLAQELERRGRRVRALHGDLAQSQRDSVMIAFRAGRCRLLVATGVAGRGLDVSRVSHVINYELPDDALSYVHRIGRTGRAGESGIAISIVTSHDRAKLAAISALTGSDIPSWGGVASDEAAASDVPVAPTLTPDAAAVPRTRNRRGRRGGRKRPAAVA